MARKLRLEEEGAIQHVVNRGNRRARIFHDDRDARLFVREFLITAEQYEWRWLSYCLMPNHFHLLIETPKTTLGDGMQRLETVYAQRYNDRYEPDGGHVFQGRYHSTLIDTPLYIARAFRYVGMNPVRGKLCVDPREWRWSSLPWVLTGAEWAEGARLRIEELLEDWGGLTGTRYPALFDEAGPFPALLDRLDDQRPSLADLLAALPRAEALREARRVGYTLAEIGAAVGAAESTVWRWLQEPPAAAA